MKIGDIIWVGMGAEVFNEIRIQIKEMATSRYTFFSSLSNGCIGYIPTEEEFLLGGYEVDIAPFAYRLPGRFQVNTADKVITRTKVILSEFD